MAMLPAVPSWRDPRLHRAFDPLSMVRVMRRNFLSWRRFYGASLVSALGDPLLLLIGIGYGLGRYVGPIDGVPFAQYLASGVIASTVMNVATFETTFSTFARMREQRTYDAIRATPVSLTEIMAGDLLWAALKCVLFSGAIALVLLVAGLLPSAWAALLPVAGFALGFPFGAIGLCVTARARSWDSFTYYFTLGVSTMFFFSGIFFPLAALPAPVRLLAWCLPLAHAVAVTRALALGSVGAATLFHLAALAAIFAIAFRLAVRWMHARLVV